MRIELSTYLLISLQENYFDQLTILACVAASRGNPVAVVKAPGSHSESVGKTQLDLRFTQLKYRTQIRPCFIKFPLAQIDQLPYNMIKNVNIASADLCRPPKVRICDSRN